MPLRGSVLCGAPIQRQARVLVRLPGARRAGDTPQQPRRRVAEDTQNMNPHHPPLTPYRYVRDRQRPAYIVHLVNIPPGWMFV